MQVLQRQPFPSSLPSAWLVLASSLEQVDAEWMLRFHAGIAVPTPLYAAADADAGAGSQGVPAPSRVDGTGEGAEDLR